LCHDNPALNIPRMDAAVEIQEARLRQLFVYWRGKCQGEAFPTRAEIDPVDFRFVLGNVFLVALEGDPLVFRYRLFGMNLARRAGYDLTGRTVEEIPAEDMRAYLRGQYLAMVAQPAPRVDRGERRLEGLRRFELLLLPLSGHGRRLDMILGALLYTDLLTPG
jgi:hypothetical protein